MPYFAMPPDGTNSLVFTLREVCAGLPGAAAGLKVEPPGTNAVTVVDIFTLETRGFMARPWLKSGTGWLFGLVKEKLVDEGWKLG